MVIKVLDKTPQELEDEGSSLLGFQIIKRLGIKDALALKILPNELLERRSEGDEVAASIVDLSALIAPNSSIEIIRPDSQEGLEIIRHDTAHLLAQAVKELYPETQVTIGPVIKDGFYYDFYRSDPFNLEDLTKIEEKMRQLAAKSHNIVKEVWQEQEAIDYFKSIGEEFKVELIEDICTNDKEAILSVYRQGDFVDLCRGPHGPNTKPLKFFKLLKVAGAYWRGDQAKSSLQRIYGTAWATAEELDKYLHFLSEAEKRDHRKLGQTMELFHLQEEAPGQVFWHPKGWTLYQILENYIRQKLKSNNYIEVKTPIMLNYELWQQSGHWEKFRSNMFTTNIEDKISAIKPMSCPCHIQIFNRGPVKSYRNLPLRMAEFGFCHRNEPSGSLHGLMRVRGFVQDDAHIFCTEEQINVETIDFCNLLQEVYKELGFDKLKVRFSDRPELRAGEDHVWDKAELALEEAVKATGLSYTLNKGEGAFYGPKLEFVLEDALGREWQCGTLQVDFVLPQRLKAYYTDAKGQRLHPVMIHRAILGTFERFIGILLEHYGGKLPLWLAPVQIVIASITNDCDDYANSLFAKYKDKYRMELDISSQKIGYKINHHSTKKVPVIWSVGRKEVESNRVSIRYLNNNQNFSLSVDEAINELEKQLQNRG